MSDLSKTQLDVFNAIAQNDLTLLQALLAEKPNVNTVDENQMTPLQHAAYKGNKEMVQTLLDYGADPNLCQHQHNYTSLHFGGLSGSVEVCIALLTAGAKTDATNTVNRTAAQMAAFVGHHNCVATINQYLPKAEIDLYVKNDTLPLFLADSLHRFLMQLGVHPIRVALNAVSYAGMAEHLPEVKKTLRSMCEKEMKRGRETNEVRAFKCHYLSTIVEEVGKLRAKHGNEQKKVVEVFARKLLKPNDDGQLEILDLFLRDCIKSFQFKECTLFRQMVAALAGKEPPSALSVVGAAINGQRGFVDNVGSCSTCGEEKPPKKCSKCKMAQYCDRNCQVLHWNWHKAACASLLEEAQRAGEVGEVKPDGGELSKELQNLLVQD